MKKTKEYNIHIEITRLTTYSFVHWRTFVQGEDVTWLGRLFVMEDRFQAVERLTVPICDKQ